MLQQIPPELAALIEMLVAQAGAARGGALPPQQVPVEYQAMMLAPQQQAEAYAGRGSSEEILRALGQIQQQLDYIIQSQQSLTQNLRTVAGAAQAQGRAIAALNARLEQRAPQGGSKNV